MTITSIATQIDYTGNGVTLAFAIPFPFDTSADIKVTQDGAEITTGFTITGGGGSTGTCTFDTAPTADVLIRLLDNPELIQDHDYTRNDAFPAESHEQALDRLTRIAKRHDNRINQGIRFADGVDLDSDDFELSPLDNWKNKYLAFDSDGKPTPADIVTGTITQEIIGGLLYPITPAESAAGVTPVNYYVPSHDAYGYFDFARYGGSAGASVATNDAAIAAALLVAEQAGFAKFKFGPGVWDYSALIRGKFDKISVFGSGIGVTELRPVGWIDVLQFADATYPNAAVVLKKVTVSDLTINGVNQLAGANDTYGNGLNFNDVDDVFVHNVETLNVQNQHIVSTYYKQSGSIQKKFIVSNCFCDGVRANQTGIGIEGEHSYFAAYGNTIVNNSGIGIQQNNIGGGATTNGRCNIYGNIIEGATGGTGLGIYVIDVSFKNAIHGNVIVGMDISIRTSSFTGAGSITDLHIHGNDCIDFTSAAIVAAPMKAGDNSLAYIHGNKCRSSVATAVTSYCILADTGAHVGTNDLADAAIGVKVNTGATLVIVDKQFNTCATKISDGGTGTIIYGETITYTPTWTSSGTAPAIGNGSISGRYTRNGDWVTAEIAVVFGSTSTFGTGTYFFSLPLPIGTLTYAVGQAQITDNGVNEYVGIVRADNTNGMRIFTSASPSAAVGPTTPFTFGNADQILINISYPVAAP